LGQSRSSECYVSDGGFTQLALFDRLDSGVGLLRTETEFIDFIFIIMIIMSKT